MRKATFYILLVTGLGLILTQCAKRGTPNGGPKDTLAPQILKSNPENYTIQFKNNEIKIYFDEFIKLNELQQNLIVSPPLKNNPIITPISSSKILKIKIEDTLKENTTYVFNFGNSIVDNNENNPFEDYKYVFSTGEYIDSLTLKGTVKESLLPTLKKVTNVLLFQVNENYTDSIIYLEKPFYVSKTKKDNPNFEFTNLKEGTYKLIALQEEASNFTFESLTDKIAFNSEFITLPKDTSYQLTLFTENKPYKVTRPSHISKYKIAFGFEGNADSLTIEPQFTLPENFEYKWQKPTDKDSLYFWFKPAFNLETTDTLSFVAKNKTQLDTVLVKLRDLYADSLQVTLQNKATIIPRDSVHLSVNTPLISFFEEKVTVINRDSVFIPTKSILDTLKHKVTLIFDKAEEQSYQIKILPEAFYDFFENTNDTLTFGVKTRAIADYGTLRFTLENVKSYPCIVEVVNEKFEAVQSIYTIKEKEVYFDYLNPGNYYLRITYDTNSNKKWDTGNFLNNLQPEEIYYYPTLFEVRANWDVVEIINLE